MTDFGRYIADWASDLEILLQNDLLSQQELLDFATECGSPPGINAEAVAAYIDHGWLLPDRVDSNGGNLYHPFRIYPLHQAMSAARLKIPAWASLLPERFDSIIGGMKRSDESIAGIDAYARKRNNITSLALLLEPLYWPRIAEQQVLRDALDDADYEQAVQAYRLKIHELIKTLDPEVWIGIHSEMRRDASKLDPNESLYLMLRLSRWEERNKLRGRIRGALWLRHMAEVIRRAFEEVHSVHWIEEDQVNQLWIPESRKIAYGFVRPLDQEEGCRPYVAFNYGLITGSAVRWYVEGETEVYAVSRSLPSPEESHIELVDLKGNIKTGKGNIAINLENMLAEDIKQKRFSMASFDMDVAENVKQFRILIQRNQVVGFIAAHDPDFEFCNFTIDELVEVAAGLDEASGYDGGPLREADWFGITNAKSLENKYKQVSARAGASLKGENWGSALADYAAQRPHRRDTGKERPFCHEINVALSATTASYDLHSQRFGFDEATFNLVDLWAGKQKPYPWI